MNILIGLAQMRVATSADIADIWYRNTASRKSANQSAYRALHQALDLDVVKWQQTDTVKHRVWMLTEKGRRVIPRDMAPRKPSLLTTISTHTLLVTSVFGFFARSITDAHRSIGRHMTMIGECEVQISTAPGYQLSRADAVLGMVSSPPVQSRPQRTSVFHPIAWTSWDTVVTVLTQNLKGRFDEIAGYYALEVDTGRYPVSRFEVKAHAYHTGRRMPPRNDIGVAPIPLIVTQDDNRARRIVELWYAADPQPPVFAADFSALKRDGLFASVWWTYDKAIQTSVRASPFAGLYTMVAMGAHVGHDVGRDEMESERG